MSDNVQNLVRDRYRLLHAVGDRTWRGLDTKSGDVLAVRIEPCALTMKPADLGRVVETERQLRVWAVPRVRDVFAQHTSAGPECVIISDWVTGLTLRQHVDTHGGLDWREAQEMAHDLIDALEELHDAGVVHGRLSPDRVILGNAGPRVVSLGGIPAVCRDGWSTVGDPHFSAPEVQLGSPNPRSDLYSVGALIAYAILGPEADFHKVREPLMRAGTPDRLAELCDRLLQPMGTGRITSASILRKELSAAATPTLPPLRLQDDLSLSETESDTEALEEAWTHEANWDGFRGEERRELKVTQEDTGPTIPVALLLGSVATAFCAGLVGGATGYAALAPTPEVVAVASAEEVQPGEAGPALPLSCPGGMEFARADGQTTCTDDFGTQEMYADRDGQPVLIDAGLVTVARYEACRDERACSALPEPCGDSHNATCLSRNQAVAYCTWSQRRMCSIDELELVEEDADVWTQRGLLGTGDLAGVRCCRSMD